MEEHQKTFCVSGKEIDVYDNLFNFIDRQRYYMFATTAFYTSRGFDGPYEQEANQFCRICSNEDVYAMNFYNTRAFSFLNEKYKLDNREIVQSRINLSNCFEHSVAHSDGKGITLIYFMNLKWNVFDGGHTIFLSEDLSEIEHILTYKPGRLSIFKGSIPHCVSPISIACREHRYTFVIQYTEEKFINYN